MQLSAAVRAALQQKEPQELQVAAVSDDPVRNEFLKSLQRRPAAAASSSDPAEKGISKVTFGFAALRNAVGGAWLGWASNSGRSSDSVVCDQPLIMPEPRKFRGHGEKSQTTSRKPRPNYNNARRRALVLKKPKTTGKS